MRNLDSSIARLRREGSKKAPDDRCGWKVKRSAQLLFFGLVAFVAVSCGNPAGSETLNLSFEPLSCLAPTCEDVTVTIGDVTISVPGDGNLRFVNDADLRFFSVAVTEAMISMRDAEEALENLIAPPTQEKLQVAEMAVAEAQLEISVAKEGLRLAEAGATELDLAEARLSVKSAELVLQLDRKALEEFIAGPTSQEFAQARQTEAQAAVALDQNLDNLGDFDLQYKKNLAVALRAETDVELALIAAMNAKSDFSEALASSLEFDNIILIMRQLTLAVENAQIDLNIARDDRAELEGGSDALLRQQLEADIEVERANLMDALQVLRELQSRPDPTELALMEAQVVFSEVNLVTARANLATLTLEPVPEVVEQARIDLVLALVELVESENELLLVTEKPEQLDLDLARMRIGVAVEELAVAEGVLRDSTNDSQLADSGVLEMVALVDESDVGGVVIGQEAAIIVRALPDKVVQGRVAHISTEAITRGPARANGTVMYEVRILAAGESVRGLNLSDGMTASVEIFIERRANVLYLPVAAVNGGDQPSVELVADGAVTSASVTLGLKNSTRVEIKEGLKEGDTVRVDQSNGRVLPIN